MSKLKHFLKTLFTAPAASLCALIQVCVFVCGCARFGIGRFTTEEEVDYTADKCIQQVSRLREMR